MKKRFFAHFGIFIVGLFLISIPLTFAHEILPQDILKLIQENPNITAEQIDNYIKDNKNELQSSGGSAQILLGVRDSNAGLRTIIPEFIKLGILHILSGPDHILFVLSLLLVFINLKSMFKLVTAFTIAHSITLILGGSGFFTLSSRIVEPLIAFSIAYMAITSVFLQQHTSNTEKKPRNTFWIVFFFGLFHGLGFAGLLQDIAVPQNHFISALLFFNVGIEIGQLFIISLALPYIYLLRNKPWYGAAMKFIAILISQVALIWFVERLFSFNLVEFVMSA